MDSVAAQLAAMNASSDGDRVGVTVDTFPGITVHVDGDYLAYYASGKDTLPAGEAWQNVTKRVAKLKRLTGADKVYMHLTAATSHKGHRFHVAYTQPYQGQRNHSKRPDNWEYLRERLENHDGSYYTPKLLADREADDACAHVLETLARSTGKLHVVHYRDKDFRMFAGQHLSWDFEHCVRVPVGSYEVVGTDGLTYGHKWFWLQMLHGDTADHIPGVQGIGPAKAEAALAGTTNNAEACAIVRALYDDDDRFVEQSSLLWMRVGRQAPVDDFLSLGVFGPAVLQATGRMQQRVRESLAALAEYA